MKDFKNILFVGLFLSVEAYLLSILGNYLLPKFVGKFEILFFTSIVASYALFAILDKKAVNQRKKILAGAIVLLATFLLNVLLAAAMYYFWELF